MGIALALWQLWLFKIRGIVLHIELSAFSFYNGVAVIGRWQGQMSSAHDPQGLRDLLKPPK